MSSLSSIHVTGFEKNRDISHTKHSQSCKHKAHPTRNSFGINAARFKVLAIKLCVKMSLSIGANKRNQDLSIMWYYITTETICQVEKTKLYYGIISYTCILTSAPQITPFYILPNKMLNPVIWSCRQALCYFIHFLSNVLNAPFNFLSKFYSEGENVWNMSK